MPRHSSWSCEQGNILFNKDLVREAEIHVRKGFRILESGAEPEIAAH